MATILSVIGARPQFIKAAVVSRSIAQRPLLDEVLVHTGQHFDANMSDIFFDELAIPRPSVNLGIAGGSHGDMTGQMLAALDALIIEQAPDLVLVYGDTNSTLAGALAAAKLGVPVAHVEAGLRSYNRTMPEEINRKVADHVSDMLLCPTQTAVDNLSREGLEEGVFHVGDVMYDLALLTRDRARARVPKLAAELRLVPGRFVLATVHRAENTANREALVKVIEYLRAESRHHPVVMPLHPRTRAAATAFGIDLGQIRTIEPIGYVDMAALIHGAACVLTDSGGVQKEACFARTPCVTLRAETEWPETIAGGWNRLWSEPEYAERREVDDFGDGTAAEKIVDCLVRFLGCPAQ